MYRFSRNFIRFIYLATDMFCIFMAIFFACKLSQTAFSNVSIYYLFFDPSNPFRTVFVTWVLASVLALNSRSLYETKRELVQGYEIVLIFRSIFYSTVATILITYMFKFHGFPRSILLYGTILTLVFLVLWRTVKRSIVAYLVANRGYNNSNAIIVGAGASAVALYEEIRSNPALGVNVVGFIDDTVKKVDESSPSVMGGLNDLEDVARRHFVSKIYVSSDLTSEQISAIGETAICLGAAFLVVPQGYSLINGSFSKHYIRTIPVLEYRDGAPFRFQIGKRIFDLCLSTCGVIVLSPLFLILSILVGCTSRGGIIHISKRYGRSGRIFNMYKFRSMYRDAEERLKDLEKHNEIDGPIFKIKKDPRITPIGRWLRRYSLDELPQLFNVIKGDMSLVGPRPFLVEHVESQDLQQWRRLEVKPGITGLWQVKGRNDVSFQKLLRLDSWYIDNWSYWLDIVILLQTLPAVIKAKGAY